MLAWQRSFLALTRFDVILRWALVVLAVALLVPWNLGDAELRLYLIIPVLGLMGVAGALGCLASGLVASGALPRWHARLFRRVWLLACFWTALPLLAVGGAVFLFMTAFDLVWWRGEWDNEWWPTSGPLVAFVVFFAALAGVPWMWRRSWERLRRTAAVPDVVADSAAVRWAFELVRQGVKYVCLAALILGVSIGATFLLDTFLPHWWRGD